MSYLKQTATFDLPYYPKTNTSTHLLSMHPCDTIDNPHFFYWLLDGLVMFKNIQDTFF